MKSMGNETNSSAVLDGGLHSAAKSKTLPAWPRSVLWLLLLFGLFSIDIWTPDGLTLPLCYAAGLLLVIGLPRNWEKIWAASTCSLLMVLDGFLSPTLSGVFRWVYLFNHTLAILLIWLVVILVLRHRRIEEVMHANERIANERLAQLNTIYASAPVGLCFVDRDLRYVSKNNALAAMNGNRPEYFIGKTVREARPDLPDAVEQH